MCHPRSVFLFLSVELRLVADLFLCDLDCCLGCVLFLLVPLDDVEDGPTEKVVKMRYSCLTDIGL